MKHNITLPSLRELGLLPYAPETKPSHRPRWKSSPYQLYILTQAFQRTPFPSKEARLLLSLTLEIPPRTLQIWFQNRRQALKGRKVP